MLDQTVHAAGASVEVGRCREGKLFLFELKVFL